MTVQHLALLVLGGATSGAALCPLTHQTTVAVYNSRGATADCRDWEAHFFEWWAGADARVQMARLSEVHVKHSCNLGAYPNLTLWVQPGGNALFQEESLGAEGKASLRQFLRRPGSYYLGTCAGWYYAAADYWWQGAHYTYPDLLGLFPVTVEGSITNIWDDSKPPGYTLTSIRRSRVGPSSAADGSSANSSLTALYWGGPTLGWNHTSKPSAGSELETLLTFESIPGSLPAAILDRNHLFFSVHLEAYEGHPSGVHLTPEQRLANYRMRAQLINKMTGKNWQIP